MLSVVLEEAKHRNASAYQRLRKLCADPSRRFFVFANENHRYHHGNFSSCDWLDMDCVPTAGVMTRAWSQALEAQLHQMPPLPGGSEFCRETFIKTQPGETPNDRNDRAIRVAAAWYTRRIPAMRIVLLSNDVDNRRKAAEAGITTMSVQVTCMCSR